MFHIVTGSYGKIGLFREIRRTEKRIYVEHMTGDRYVAMGNTVAYLDSPPFLSLPDETQTFAAYGSLKATLDRHRAQERALYEQHRAEIAAFKTADWSAVTVVSSDNT